MGKLIAFVIVLVVILLAVFDDPQRSIYGSDIDEDDEMPPDARAWRDPWGDTQ